MPHFLWNRSLPFALKKLGWNFHVLTGQVYFCRLVILLNTHFLKIASVFRSILTIFFHFFQIVPRVDSIGLNEQELWMVCRIGGGPHCNDKGLDGPPSIAIASDILHWMLDALGRSGGSRLTRIHFHTLTYHMAVVADPSPWRNQASAVLAGTRIAATQACDDLDQVRPEKLELRVTGEVRLSMLSNDEKFTRTFDPGRPVMTWHRPEMTFHLSPVLVCRKPVKTVGLGDAISATGLYYSGFER